jgi:large subunit ribosomal protein L28
MPTQCACGKNIKSLGNRIIRHGLPKKSGGIGLHTTGITRRSFKRNVQKIRVRLPDGSVKTLRVCTRCIKAGKFQKA